MTCTCIEGAAAEALARYGAEAQIGMIIEECSELIVALSHYRRGRALAEKVAEEYADVLIMLAQLRLILEAEGVPVGEDVDRKLKRLKARLADKGER